MIQTNVMSTGNGGFQKITDYYNLKTSYLFDPKREREHRRFMAPRMITENESLESHLSKFQGDLMADQTPKRIYSGDPGNGKTHLLLHVSEKLTSNDFEFKHGARIRCRLKYFKKSERLSPLEYRDQLAARQEPRRQAPRRVQKLSGPRRILPLNGD